MPSPSSALLVSLAAFHTRLWLGGLLAATLVPVSLVAALLDWAAGRGPEAGHYARVRREAAMLDRRLVHLERRATQSDAPDSVRESAPARRSPVSA